MSNGKEKLNPEEKARIKIDSYINDAGWEISNRDSYVSINSLAVRKSLMKGNKKAIIYFLSIIKP